MDVDSFRQNQVSQMLKIECAYAYRLLTNTKMFATMGRVPRITTAGQTTNDYTGQFKEQVVVE